MFKKLKKIFCIRHDWKLLRFTSGDENNLYPSRTIVKCKKCDMENDAGRVGFPTVNSINSDITKCGVPGKISDGYHTFDELYEHRCLLFLALAKTNKQDAWKAWANSDGTRWEGWFVLGLYPEVGKQITYHLPDRYWDKINGISEFEVSPYYDGHTSDDALERLGKL